MAINVNSLSSNLATVDGSARSALSFNHEGAQQPATYIWWVNQNSSSNNYYFESRTGVSTAYRRGRAQSSANQTRGIQETAGGNVTVTHNRPTDWLLCILRFIDDTDRDLTVYALDGNSWTSSVSNTVTNASVQSDFIFRAGDQNVYMQDMLVCNTILPVEIGKQIAMGASPLSFCEVRESLVLYEPLESRGGEWSASPSLAIDPTTVTSDIWVTGRPSQKYVVPPRFVPAILEAPAGGSTQNIRRFLSNLVQR